MYPRYSYPAGLIAGLLRDLILLRPRSFQADARACVARLDPPMRVLGQENIPREGPCVITVNHYYRPGFGAQWFALAISARISVNVHWLMTGELTFPGKWFAPVATPTARIILGRLARLYGFATMPPMPPRPQDVQTRAGAVLAVLDYVKHTQNPVIGLAPEGADPPNGQLTMPATGLGRFCLLLADQCLKFIPVGVYESNGGLYLNFGNPYPLEVFQTESPDERDRAAAHIVMSHIARLLPSCLRGKFA